MKNGNGVPVPTGQGSPFERIRRVSASGAEFWSSREFAQVLGYTDYRNFEQVVKKAKTACFSSGQRIEDHLVDITKMIEIGKGSQEMRTTQGGGAITKWVRSTRQWCCLSATNCEQRAV